MAIPIDTLVRVNWLGRCFGQRITLTTSWEKTAGPVLLTDVAEMNGLIDVMVVGGALDILTTYMALLPASYATERIVAQPVFLTRATGVVRNVATPGTHASPATVANDSACITLKGNFAGAKRRSNKHIGPCPDAASASGLLVAGYITLLNNLGTKLVTNVALAGGETYKPVVFKIINPGSAPSHILNQFSVGLQARVQRRRTVGLGE